MALRQSLSSLVVFAFLLGFSSAFYNRKILWQDADSLAVSPDADVPWTQSPDPDFKLDTKDPKVIGLAKFAIDEYNKQHKSNLVYVVVLEALATTEARGTKYDLVLEATNNDDLSAYEVVVFSDRNVNKLVLFKKIK